MSRILRRPMFRGGPVDSRGTGITSGLMDGGRVGFDNGGSPFLRTPILMSGSQITESQKSKPYLDPAIEHIVIVPGPIKAAAITVPGPMFFIDIKIY